jgi:hypothetical protein
MKMYKMMRNIHLWLGLVLALFILLEACTGLLQAEPWLLGMGEEEMHEHFTNALHEGRLGDVSVKWVIDTTAVGLIVLTLTGIYLSVPLLKSRRGR